MFPYLILCAVRILQRDVLLFVSLVSVLVRAIAIAALVISCLQAPNFLAVFLRLFGLVLGLGFFLRLPGLVLTLGFVICLPALFLAINLLVFVLAAPLFVVAISLLGINLQLMRLVLAANIDRRSLKYNRLRHLKVRPNCFV